MSWFVYVVTENVIYGDEILNKGERGVGQCSMSPGIMEAPHGMMYVIPDDFVVKHHKSKGRKKISALLVEDAARIYFGVNI